MNPSNEPSQWLQKKIGAEDDDDDHDDYYETEKSKNVKYFIWMISIFKFLHKPSSLRIKEKTCTNASKK